VVEAVPYQYNWTDVAAMIRTGLDMNMQQIWDLCHFGFPTDLTPLHPHFCQRFVSLCKAFIQLFRTIDTDAPIIITPINEVSFLSWLGGEVACTSPFCKQQGWEVKYNLMKAFIKGVEAMKAMDDNIIILTTEPLINVTAAPEA